MQRLAVAFAAALFIVLALPAVAEVAGRISLSELLERPVVNEHGEAIGELTDVVFDARDGAILAVTIDYGRWLRISSHEADFAPRQVSLGGERVVLHVAERELRRMPEAQRPAWPAMSAAWLIGREVRDRLRRDSGEMIDLLADLEGARVEAAIVELPDEWQTATHERIALPLRAFTLPRDVGGYATLGVRREDLSRP